MTIETKSKSHPKPVPSKSYVDFESILERLSKKYQSDDLAKRLHTNNQRVCIPCPEPTSNKNERECKQCGCDHFYVPTY